MGAIYLSTLAEFEVFFSLQGTPEFVAVSQCVHYFEWRTYAACKNNKFKPQKEVGGGHMTEKMKVSNDMAKLFLCQILY